MCKGVKDLLKPYPYLVVCIVLVHLITETRLVHCIDNVTVQQVYKLNRLALRKVPTETRNKGALYKLGVTGTLLKRPDALTGSLNTALGKSLHEFFDAHLLHNLLVVKSERLTSKHLLSLV